MSSWHQGPLALFDVESSGVDPHRDRIVSAAVISANAGITRSRTWLLNPGIDIPAEATAVHGYSTDYVREHGTDATTGVAEIYVELHRLLGLEHTIVGHNVSFDLTMLHAELVRHGRTDMAHRIACVRPVVDTIVLDRWADPWRPKEPTRRRPDPALCGSRRLVDVARLYGVPLTEQDAHGAEADALAAGRIAWQIAQRHPGCQGPALDVHDWLVGIAREQADRFGAWLTQQGKTDDVSRHWPVEPPPRDWSPEQLPAPRVAEAVA